MSVYINRVLNMKKIKAIGIDMDYTLVEYNSEAFERVTFHAAISKLIEQKKYPKEIKKLKFNFKRVIQGLVIDKKRGNILKLSRFGKVKQCFYGTKQLPFRKQQELYQQRIIELGDDNYYSLDTNFSISNGVLYMQLVELKKKLSTLPDFDQMALDVREMIDLAHRDGTLKQEVSQNLKKYIIRDPRISHLLEKYKRFGKKILLITNSDFHYTKTLLNYTITPFLKEHKCWSDLFDIVVTQSQKPDFFTSGSYFLEIEQDTGKMTNTEKRITSGIYQGGNAQKIQRDLNLKSDEILYLGDHIYGDVVAIKKTVNWRTALVLEPLKEEVDGLKRTKKLETILNKDMQKKELLEQKINLAHSSKLKQNNKKLEQRISGLYRELEALDKKISNQITTYQKHFNPFWGELMRSGHEESRFADQVEKYACVYVTRVADLFECSPRSYFRPKKRYLPHEY